MGINLVRWFTDDQYRAVKRWKRHRGDATLRLDYALGPDAVIVDAGTYIGDFAEEIAKRGGGRVFGFEPIPTFADKARARVAARPNVEIFTYGLSNKDETARITVDGAASSSKAVSETMIDIELRAAADVFAELGIEAIDLIKINIEGGEYDLLPHLYDRGWMQRIRDIQVQFHLLADGDRERYEAIAAKLRETHDLTWRYPFIWENWRRRSGP